MDGAALLIRPARFEDLEAFAAIYGQAVRDGTASYELEAPDAREMGRRLAEIEARGMPWLVAEGPGGEVLGYAYAGPFRTRPAYNWTVENSIYVSSRARGRGVAGALLDRLLDECTARGYRTMVAVIGDASNAASVALHARAGFHEVGRLPGMGWKHGRWLEWLMMARALGQGDTTPPL